MYKKHSIDMVRSHKNKIKGYKTNIHKQELDRVNIHIEY